MSHAINKPRYALGPYGLVRLEGAPARQARPGLLGLPSEAFRPGTLGLVGDSNAPGAGAMLLPSALRDRPKLRDIKIDRREQPNGEDGVRFSLMQVAKKITEGRLSPQVRAWAMRQLDAAGNPKGPLARAKVLLEATRGNRKQGRWAPDPTDAEFIPDAELMISTCKDDKIGENGVCELEEIASYFALGDCFAEGTLMLNERHELVPVEKLVAGQKIWGLDRWSEIKHVIYKGTLPIDVISLNNGSDLKLTSEHHVYVLDCPEHPMLEDVENPKALPEDRHWRGGGKADLWGCACELEKRTEKRTRVSEVRPGMVMPAPSRIPFGTDAMDVDRALVEGGYRYIEDHGGLGENGIYRLGTRGKDPWLLRVRSVEREVAEMPCWDIQTDDHRVYLAEHDVTVSQCDDLTVQFGSSVLAPMIMLAAAGNAGVYGAVVGHAYDEGKHIQHVLAAIYAEGRWHYCDPSLPEMPFGECKPFTRERIIYVPSLEVGCDADVCLKPGGKASGPPSFADKGEFIGASVAGVPDDDDLQREIPDGIEPFVEIETTGIGMVGAANDVGELGRGGGGRHGGYGGGGHGRGGRHGDYRGRVWWNDGWEGAGWHDWPWAYAVGPDYEVESACSHADAADYLSYTYGRHDWWRDVKIDNDVLSVLATDANKAMAALPASVCGYKVVVTTLGTPKNAPTLGQVWYDYR